MKTSSPGVRPQKLSKPPAAGDAHGGGPGASVLSRGALRGAGRVRKGFGAFKRLVRGVSKRAR